MRWKVFLGNSPSVIVYGRIWPLQKTPQERIAAMAKLQEAMWEALHKSPELYAHFLWRDFKARAIEVPSQMSSEDEPF